MPEPIVLLTRPGIEVVKAPREALITLDVLRAADPRCLHVAGDLITIAGQVVYRVVGWQPTPPALLCWLAEDNRPKTAGGSGS